MSAIHDPLCRWHKQKAWPKRFRECDCGFIARVRAEYVNPDCVWGEGECVPGCPSCKRMDDLRAEREAGYADGVADERVKARQRVEATWQGWCADPYSCSDYEHPCAERARAARAAGGDA